MPTHEQFDAIGHQHKQTWERLYSILGSAKTGKGGVCHQLAQLPVTEREEFVRQIWGQAGLDRVYPILLQIASLEAQADRIEAAKIEATRKG